MSGLNRFRVEAKEVGFESSSFLDLDRSRVGIGIISRYRQGSGGMNGEGEAIGGQACVDGRY